MKRVKNEFNLTRTTFATPELWMLERKQLSPAYITNFSWNKSLSKFRIWFLKGFHQPFDTGRRSPLMGRLHRCCLAAIPSL